MPFKTAVLSLTGSLALHTLAAVSFSVPDWQQETSSSQPMEISYVRYAPEKHAPQPKLILQAPAQIKYPPVVKTETKTKESVIALKAVSRLPNNTVEKAGDKSLVTIGDLAVKSEGTMPTDPKKGKILSNYFGLVKQRIRQTVEKSYSRENLGRGNIMVTFVLKSDGTLVKVFPAQRSSGADELMKYFAVRCIRQCSPFPRFPKELGMDRITFNLSIQFDEAA